MSPPIGRAGRKLKENPPKSGGFSGKFALINYLPPILNIPVPHTGHLPFIAGLPFFNVTGTAVGSSRFARHLTQYMLDIFLSPPFTKNLTKIYKVNFVRNVCNTFLVKFSV